MQFKCPICSDPMQCPDEYADRKVKCPTCNQRIVVPAPVVLAANKARRDETPSGDFHDGKIEIVGEEPKSPAKPIAALAPTKKRCAECGEFIRARAKFCPECGDEQPRPRRRYAEAEDESPGEWFTVPTGILTGVLVSIISRSVLGATIMGVLGLFSSQYRPVFGGFLELNLAQPWSPARMSLIPLHLFAFVMTGIVLGGAIGAVVGLSMKESPKAAGSHVAQIVALPILLLATAGVIVWVVMP